MRAVRQLRQLYELDDDADWEDILQQRIEWLRSDPERLARRCFQGVHALLIDDGLAEAERVYPFRYHDRYTTGSSKRIVRIEKIAEALMESLLQETTKADLAEERYWTDTWLTFTEDFESEIQKAVEDPDVAGFKTVICYRTGLDIEPDYQRAARAVAPSFERYVERCVRTRKYRIEKKRLNDYIVLRTLEVLSERLPHTDVLSKPLQFHVRISHRVFLAFSKHQCESCQIIHFISY